MVYFVYTLSNSINDKLYVGKTNNPQKRWCKHCWLSLCGPGVADFSVIHAAMAKHKIENFRMNIISAHDEEKEALAAEIKLIAELKENGTILYNCTIGGEGTSGYKHTPEMCQYFSQLKSKQIVSVDTRKKISNSMKGKIRSQAHCAAIKKHRTGTKCPEIVKKKNAKRFEGENSNTAKLTTAQVIEIKKLLHTMSRKDIAILFNVKTCTITDIALARSWKHLEQYSSD